MTTRTAGWSTWPSTSSARWLRENHAEVANLIERRAPSWTPQWLDKRVASWVHDQVVDLVAEIARTPDHNARIALDNWLKELARDLQHDPDTMERFERLKVRMLAQPGRQHDVRAAVGRAAPGADRLARPTRRGCCARRATEELERLGRRLIDDPALSERVDTAISNIAAYAVNNYGHEVATIISATVNRWDGKETADRIELHVGRDLQFIRINGTVVGGLAGLVIHAISTAL